MVQYFLGEIFFLFIHCNNAFQLNYVSLRKNIGLKQINDVKYYFHYRYITLCSTQNEQLLYYDIWCFCNWWIKFIFYVVYTWMENVEIWIDKKQKMYDNTCNEWQKKNVWCIAIKIKRRVNRNEGNGLYFSESVFFVW